jgi:putative hydrolase of the HAD superfamily
MIKYKCILFDAANTLIHKPDLFPAIGQVLRDYGHEVPEQMIRKNHKLISEVLVFPDVTSESFYSGFNAELLYSLGIVPTNALLADIFKKCSYLPWHMFEDAACLTQITLPKGILSNFNTSLVQKINLLFNEQFSHLAVSETMGLRKPDPAFYRKAIEGLGYQAEELLYIGDSLKLDIEPAEKLNMNAILIDREGMYPQYKNRISSFEELAGKISTAV